MYLMRQSLGGFIPELVLLRLSVHLSIYSFGIRGLVEVSLQLPTFRDASRVTRDLRNAVLCLAMLCCAVVCYVC